MMPDIPAHQDDLEIFGDERFYLLHQSAQAPHCQPLVLPRHHRCAHLHQKATSQMLPQQASLRLLQSSRVLISSVRPAVPAQTESIS